MIFQPWIDFDTKEEIAAEIDVSEPPCRNCRRWAPRRVYAYGQFQGVQLCHAQEMQFDFSCFRAKDAADPDQAKARD